MADHSQQRWHLFLRSLPLLLLITLVCFLFHYHVFHYFRLELLTKYQLDILNWSMLHYKIAVLIYLLTFILLIACTIPCATFLTLLGGFLFGGIATIYAILGTTLGGVLLYFAIRLAFAPYLTAKSRGWIKKMETGFKQNAFYYLLMLRLLPFLPCWVSNVTAGALNVPLRTFVFATILGVAPSTFIYAMAGRGLDKLLLAGSPSFSHVLMTPMVSLPLLGLAILCLFPVIYNHVYAKDPV